SHEPGPIVDERGREIGRHVGLSFYTLGQRQGLGIGGLRSSGGTHAPWFGAAKDLARNRLIAVQGHDHPALLSRHLWAGDVSWVAGHAPAPGRLAAKTRYRQADAPCSFDAHAADAFQLDFSPPDPAQWAVTPGQSAVLYDGEVCLGGGVISQAWPSTPDAPATPAAAH
ncbi:MAG: aminomethyltransferase beta-barrel domain-containing protein, partial [Rubrivivax sp.]